MVRRATVRQTLVTTGVALLVTARAGAQGSALLRGVVYDSLISAAPLEGAEVWIEGTNRTARTDALGRFELAALAAGRYRLTFEHPVLDSTGLAAPPVVGRCRGRRDGGHSRDARSGYGAPHAVSARSLAPEDGSDSRAGAQRGRQQAPP